MAKNLENENDKLIDGFINLLVNKIYLFKIDNIGVDYIRFQKDRKDYSIFYDFISENSEVVVTIFNRDTETKDSYRGFPSSETMKKLKKCIEEEHKKKNNKENLKFRSEIESLSEKLKDNKNDEKNDENSLVNEFVKVISDSIFSMQLSEVDKTSYLKDFFNKKLEFIIEVDDDPKLIDRCEIIITIKENIK